MVRALAEFLDLGKLGIVLSVQSLVVNMEPPCLGGASYVPGASVRNAEHFAHGQTLVNICEEGSTYHDCH